ncbi:MAG: hypothetical protein ABIX10_10355 [Acidimicrobiales bacterium]
MSEAGRALLARMTTGDLVDEFQDALDADRAADPLLGGHEPDDALALPASRHWRLLQRIHALSGGQLTQLFAGLPGGDLGAVQHPHPDVLQILHPRPLLDEAAAMSAR